jgi:hypothetical protein
LPQFAECSARATVASSFSLLWRCAAAAAGGKQALKLQSLSAPADSIDPALFFGVKFTA